MICFVLLFQFLRSGFWTISFVCRFDNITVLFDVDVPLYKLISLLQILTLLQLNLNINLCFVNGNFTFTFTQGSRNDSSIFIAYQLQQRKTSR